LLASLTACAPRMSSSVGTDPLGGADLRLAPSSYCMIAKPIFWSAKDTDETLKQIKAANAVWKSLCSDEPPH
jgi:hypothetical protein